MPQQTKWMRCLVWAVSIVHSATLIYIALGTGSFYPHVYHSHDDVMKWKHFPRHWPFVRGIPQSPVNSPQKGQWSGVLMFSLICAWINGWVNQREAGDLRRHRAHYDVTNGQHFANDIPNDNHLKENYFVLDKIQQISSNEPNCRQISITVKPLL